MRPTSVIEEKFEEIFLSYSIQVFKYIMSYMNEMKGVLDCLRKKVETLYGEFSKTVNFSGKPSDLFYAKGEDIIP